MKSKHLPFYLFSALLVGLSACGGSKKPDDKLAGPPKPPVVNVYVVSTAPLTQSLDAAGTLLAEEEVQLAPEVSGRIVKLTFKEGQQVSKGQLLVKLVDADLRAQLQKLESQLQLAEITENRQKQLLEVQGVSRQDYDLTMNNLNGIKADIGVIKSQIAKTEIRAPFSGKIGLKNISEGAYITAGTVITTLQNAGSLKLDFSVPERYETLIKIGAPIEFTLDGREGTFMAKVYAVEPRISLESRSLQVRARYQNSAHLLPGAFANVVVGLTENNKAILIPTQAIIPEARNKKVVRVKNGTAEFVLVETGTRTANRVQILKGIEPGDSLVLTGLMQLKPDAPIVTGKVVTADQYKDK